MIGRRWMSFFLVGRFPNTLVRYGKSQTSGYSCAIYLPTLYRGVKLQHPTNRIVISLMFIFVLNYIKFQK